MSLSRLYVRDGRIVAVTPREEFLPFFEFGAAKNYVRKSTGGQLPPRE